jgi:hypothetical protein
VLIPASHIVIEHWLQIEAVAEALATHRRVGRDTINRLAVDAGSRSPG